MRRTTAWGCALAGAIYFTGITTFPISRAHAQPPSSTSAPSGTSQSDAIFLKGGAVVRGTIIDIVPGDHARIQLATGEVQLVPWPTIDRIERAPIVPMPPASSSPVAPPPVAPTPPVAPAPIVDTKARRVAAVTVHIDTSRTEVALQGRPGEDFEWMRVCDAPCDKSVQLAWEYRIVGDGLRASQEFMLEAKPGDRIVLTLNPATNAGYVGGILLTVAGGVVVFFGAIVFLLGVLLSGFIDNAAGVIGGGALVTGIGIVILYVGSKIATSNGHTIVNVTAPRAAPPGVNGAAAPRAALWNEIAPRAAPALPMGGAPTVPLFTVRF